MKGDSTAREIESGKPSRGAKTRPLSRHLEVFHPGYRALAVLSESFMIAMRALAGGFVPKAVW